MNELNDWILHPTKEKPNVMEWFLNWFFKQLIMKNQVERAKKALGTIIIFTIKCEKVSPEEAVDIVMQTLKKFAIVKDPEWARKMYEQLGI
jgi:hypothetical protein